MTYVLEQMTAATWDLIGPTLRDMWRSVAIQRGWHQDMAHRFIAINESRESWLCSAPVFVRDRYSAWYFFHFERVTYCFRIDSESKPDIEFYKGEPSAEVYERLRSALKSAFAVHGFYCGINSNAQGFQPNFPSLAVGRAQ